MNILLLTVSTNYHAPLLISKIIEENKDSYFKVAISNKGRNRSFRSLLKTYSVFYIFLKLIEVMIVRIFYSKSKDDKKKTVFLDAILKKYKLENKIVGDVNSEDFIEYTKKFKPDIIISIFFDQIIGSELISLSRNKPVNLHPSLLPAYAGGAPTFWVLSKGEKTTGITIHEIEQKVDQGKIVYQKQVPIQRYESQFHLYRRCVLLYAEPLLEYIATCRRGHINPVVNYKKTKNMKSSYYYKVEFVDVVMFIFHGHWVV